MNITVYRSDILDHNPCADGLKWFDDMVRMQGREDSLLIEGHLGLMWLYCNPGSRDFAAWAQSMGVLPAFNGARLDLSGLDLRETNLYGANLQGANLYRADLRWANLRGANLQEADLRETDLYRADLRWANLYGADLRWANLRWANLQEADLRWANLQEADLRETDLCEADIRGAYLQGARRLAEDPPIPGWKVVNGLLVKE